MTRPTFITLPLIVLMISVFGAKMLDLAVPIVLAEGTRQVELSSRDDLVRGSEQLSQLYNVGQIAEALALAEELHGFAEADLQPEDEEALTAKNNLAFLYAIHGRYEEAERLFSRALELRRKAFGDEHPDTLGTFDSLANVYFDQDRYEEAEPLYARALELRRKVLGEEHPDTLVNLFNLARVYEAQGRYEEAEPLDALALELRRKVLGEEHPDTLDSLSIVAGDRDAQGKDEEAERLYTKIIELRRKVLGEEHPNTLMSLYNLAVFYDYRGDHNKAERLHKRTLKLRLKVLGEDHPATIVSLTNVALLYEAKQSYDEAERLHKRALELSRKISGEEHPSTIARLNNLATLYANQGRLREAEALFVRAHKLRVQVMGEEHPYTLSSLDGLAELQEARGRYGKAESFYSRAVELRRKVLGEEHPDTLASLNGLALVQTRQGRYKEAESLNSRVLERRRELFGEGHPDTLASLNNLAFLYVRQGRYKEAEPLYSRVLERRRELFGEEDPGTLVSLNNLARLYTRQGRYDAAEPLLAIAREQSAIAVGEEHPHTLFYLHNLADVYRHQVRFAEAEPLYARALELRRKVLGEEHPHTIKTEMSAVALLVQTDRAEQAAARLERIGERLLRWTGVELTSTRQAATKRVLLNRQSSFQDVSIHLAALHPSARTRRLAADVMLRWKQLGADEEGYLAQLIRTTDDSRVVKLGKDILVSRSDLAEAYHRERHDEAAALLSRLEAREADLAKISTDFRQHRRARAYGSRDVESALPEGAALVEFRLYQPFDYQRDAFEAPRWAAVLLRPYEEPLFANLAPMPEPPMLNAAMTGGETNEEREAAAAQLYDTLFGPFDAALADVETLYISPDGALNLIPFDRLRLGDGRYLMQRQTIRIVHSGRSLVEARHPSPNRGLFAVGGVDFGSVGEAETRPASKVTQTTLLDQNDEIERAFELARGRFGDDPFRPIPQTGIEIERIARIYASRRKEPVTAISGSNASEARVKALAEPPRVAHFATHGFYLPLGEYRLARPMLLSGLSLAGANSGVAGALDGNGEDGVLFAIEASGLNLQGTELAVMSACDTAKGVIDYSEGVYGLARAFRIAGAQNTLMTLWALNDRRARDFMEAFYYAWLREPNRDPAEALREVKLKWAASADPHRSDPTAWAPYILVQSGR